MQTVNWAISSYDLKDSWNGKQECMNCHYMFDDDSDQCPACKFFVGGWQCPVCGTYNDNEDAVCRKEGCETQRPSADTCSCGCQHATGTPCPCCRSRHFKHRRMPKSDLLLANTVTVDLPDYFVQARSSRKIVGVRKITVYQKRRGEWQPVNCSVHSDTFVRSDACFDFFVCMGNVDMYSAPVEAVIGDSEPTFTFWLKDAAGNVMDVYPTKTKVIMELILKF